MYILVLFFSLNVFGDLNNTQTKNLQEIENTLKAIDEKKREISGFFTDLPAVQVDGFCKAEAFTPGCIGSGPYCEPCNVNLIIVKPSVNNIYCTETAGRVQIFCKQLKTLKITLLGLKGTDSALFRAGQGLNTATNVFSGLRGFWKDIFGKDDCFNNCKNQLQAINKNFNLFPSLTSAKKYIDDTLNKNDAQSQNLKRCLCNSSCYYGSIITKQTCTELDAVDCSPLKTRSGSTLLHTKASCECECKKISQSTGVEQVCESFKDNNFYCAVPKEETNNPDAAFAGAGDSFLDDDPFNPDKKDDKKDDKDKKEGTALAASGGGAAGGGGLNFKKDPQQWKAPYRKNDGVKNIQEGIGRGLAGQAFKQGFKAEKGKNEFIAKKEKEEAAKKDIMKDTTNILDAISKNYNQKITANAFLFIPEEKAKEPSKNLKKVNRKKN